MCKKVFGEKVRNDAEFWELFRDAMRKLAARCRRVRHAKKTKTIREEAIQLAQRVPEPRSAAETIATQASAFALVASSVAAVAASAVNGLNGLGGLNRAIQECEPKEQELKSEEVDSKITPSPRPESPPQARSEFARLFPELTVTQPAFTQQQQQQQSFV